MLLSLFLTIVPVATNDSASWLENLDEVVVTGAAPAQEVASKGHLASIDEHMEQLRNVATIRRGSYAWEPVVNNMQTERLSTTIDGMKIFSACTDRMDPVTSYVESGNLQRISLNSGLDGNPQATGNIGGSLDLKLRKTGFGGLARQINLSAGAESNGWLQVYGADGEFSSRRFYVNAGAFYRHAGNYRAGGHVGEVEYSQFQKVNVFANVGWQPVRNHIVEATFIYDEATDVGYPALNMDVGLARGVITSVSYRRENVTSWLRRWESKLYYNRIRHDMDDTHRPDVVIHMDMPGRSHTAGLYSLVEGETDRHSFQLNYDFWRNVQFADMTMTPIRGAAMYMLTWPDVATLSHGLAASDRILLGGSHSLRLSAKVAWLQSRVRSAEGYEALAIYFPGMSRESARLQGRLSATWTWDHEGWQVAVGGGWGCRAPVTTESYGYFINNTFDRYDYVGNPNLRCEKAWETKASLGWHDSRLRLKAEGSVFFFTDYIIGQPDDRLSAMTLGAAGVKIYRNLSYARIANASVEAQWKPWDFLSWRCGLSYAYGTESTGARLPLIAPLTFRTSLSAVVGDWSAEVGGTLAARHSDYSAKYGEHPTPGYGVWHLDFSYLWRFSVGKVSLRAGVENLFNRYYSTYSDWNHIPQKGRSIFFNATWSW